MASLVASATAAISDQMVLTDDTVSAPLVASQPSLADLMTIDPSISIFYSYARETELSARFSTVRDGLRTTVLAPKNRAVMALARKPLVFLFRLVTLDN
jgi:hypothetical protein